MYEVFIDALMDTVKMVPLLLVIYVGIELVEYKFGNRIIALIQKAGAAGPAVGALAVFLFSFLPPVLAHAGLATTDMALTAFLGAAFLSGLVWVE